MGVSLLDEVQGAKFGDQLCPAAINIGPNPTFGEDKLKVEVHLVDFQETCKALRYALVLNTSPATSS